MVDIAAFLILLVACGWSFITNNKLMKTNNTLVKQLEQSTAQQQDHNVYRDSVEEEVSAYVFGEIEFNYERKMLKRELEKD